MISCGPSDPEPQKLYNDPVTMIEGDIDVYTVEIELGTKPIQYSRIIHDKDTIFIIQNKTGRHICISRK